MKTNNLQLKVELAGIEPKIWRRIIVDENASLYELHHIIQLAFGWENYHLYEFEADRNFYGNVELWDIGDEINHVTDDRRVKVKELLNDSRKSIKYLYDMGDSWMHIIKLEKFDKANTLVKAPYCVAGEGNCPPEDCGGVPGYYHMLEVLKKPKSKEYKELIEWLDGKYDPDHIDIAEINEMLSDLDNYIAEYEE